LQYKINHSQQTIVHEGCAQLVGSCLFFVRNLTARSQRKCRNCLTILISCCTRTASPVHHICAASVANGHLGFRI